jgi:hypothetical protein
MEFCRGTHKIVLFRKSLVPLWLKDMELDEIKYLYLLLYYTIIGGVIFQFLLEVKKQRNLGI